MFMMARQSLTLTPAMGGGSVQDDVAAFARVERDALLGLAYVLVGNRDDAEDAVQETITRLLTVDTEKVRDLGSYARRALVNECTSWQRRTIRRERQWRTLTLEAGRLDQTSPDLFAHKDVMAALSCLRARPRAAVVLRYLLDLDDTAIAAHLGCAPATVRSLISRSMPKLRAALCTSPDDEC